MKQERIFYSFFKVGLMLFSILCLNSTVSAQAYCLQFFEKPVVGSNLDVDVYLTPTSKFNLGDSRLVISYNPASVSANNPVTFTSNLDPVKYTVTAKRENAGIVVIDISYNGLAGSGTNVPASKVPASAPFEGLRIGTIKFGIVDPTIAKDFRLLRRPNKTTLVSKDNNTTILPSSLQCPPSPYTSLFYDVNVELDAAIPMEECVESNTPGSIKIPVLGDDETREILPPGFKFKFYCEDVTSLRLGADGALLVNAVPNSTTLPTSNNFKLKTLGKAIAPLWDEWRKGMGTINCLDKILADGRRALIIQWNNVSPVDNISGSNLNTDSLKSTFNVVIIEGTSIIKFNYKDVEFLSDVRAGSNLVPVASKKQYGGDGSVGIKGLCATGLAGDGVNNILYDGPVNISLFDVRTTEIYKSITFSPISEACVVPNMPSDMIVCQGSPAFRLEAVSSAINGKWTGTGVVFLDSANAQSVKFNPTTPGSFTLNWEPDCTNLGYTVNIKVNPQATVSAGKDTTICSNVKIPLKGTIGGSATSATWTVTPAGAGTFDNPNLLVTAFTPTLKTGVITITLTTNDPEGPCPAATSSFNVTVKEVANAGTGDVVKVCSDALGVTYNLYEILKNEQTGGIWTQVEGTGGTFNAAAGTFKTDNNAKSSKFKYKVLGMRPCPDDSAFVTINIIPAPKAGTSRDTTVCENATTPVNLASLLTGAQAGGVWTKKSGLGGVFDPINGTFLAQTGATSASFQYLVTGQDPCNFDDAALVKVTIIKRITAGSSGSTTACENSTLPIDLYGIITNEDRGGTWTRTDGGTLGTFDALNGTYTPAIGARTVTFRYTVSSGPPCNTVESSIATIIISPLANAGTGRTTTVCSDDTRSITLFDFITGGQSGGIWTRITGDNGDFNAANGTFKPALNATSSTFRYTITGVFPCPNSQTEVKVNIQQRVYAGESNTTPICDNSIATINLRDIISNEQDGGIWTWVSGTGGTYNLAAGTFTPAAGATDYKFRYTLVGTLPCPNSEAIATIIIKPAANAGKDDGTKKCDNFNTPIDLFLLIDGEQRGGIWTQISGTGGTFDAAAATFTPGRGATTSRFQYVVRGIAPCSNDTSIATVELVPQADAGKDDTRTLCNKNLGAINLFDIIRDEQPGGTWSQVTSGNFGSFNAASGTFTPSVSATNVTVRFMYKVFGIAPCLNAESFATINLVSPPDAGRGGSLAICDNNLAPINLFNYIEGEQSGGIWSRPTNNGGTLDASTGIYTPVKGATSVVFTYTLSSKAPCNGDYSEVRLTINPEVYAGEDGSTTACDNSTTTITLFSLLKNAQPGGYWNLDQGSSNGFDIIAGTFKPSPGAITSKFRYTVKGTAPCIDDYSIVTVNIVPTRTPDFDPIPPICQGEFPIPLLKTTSKNGITGTWSPQFINNQITGTRTHTFTATNTACVTSATLTVTVYELPYVNAGPDQTYCTNPLIQFIMDASAIPAGGTGVWSFVGNAYGAVITDIYDPKTTVKNLEPGKTVTLRWSVKSREGCPNSDDVVIGRGINPPVIVTYDKNSVLAGTIGDLGKGDAFVCANIVIKELTDDCTSFAELFSTVTIIRDEENTSRRYRPDFPKCIQVTCRDVNKKIPTQVWVVDRDGNASFRLTYITVQDNMGFCGRTPTPQTTIAIATNGNLPVRNVTVTATLDGSAQSIMDTLSNTNGFAILKNLALGDTYSLRASKTDDKYWGVSTYDIAVISQHIVGINTITSPPVLLAADVNEDGEIDVQDMVLIRNFILRRAQNLPKRDWRFVDSSYVFQDPNAPFFENAAEIIRLDNTTPINHKAFKAIKKGDVTPQLTQPLNAFNALTARDNRQLTLQTEDIFVEKGKIYAISIIAENFDARAFQFTLNTEGVVINSVQKGDLPNLNEGQFAIFDKAMTVSWNGQSNTKSPHLFTLHITAQQAGILSNILKINSLITQVEANDSQGQTMPIQLQFNKTTAKSTTFHLYQNYPNPFGNTTTIAFDLPKDATTRLTVMTIDGKVIYTQEGKYAAGFNSITVDKNALNTTGILYYRLEAGEHSALQRMVILR
jgi:hypothetical protein